MPFSCPPGHKLAMSARPSPRDPGNDDRSVLNVTLLSFLGTRRQRRGCPEPAPGRDRFFGACQCMNGDGWHQENVWIDTLRTASHGIKPMHKPMDMTEQRPNKTELGPRLRRLVLATPT